MSETQPETLTDERIAVIATVSNTARQDETMAMAKELQERRREAAKFEPMLFRDLLKKATVAEARIAELDGKINQIKRLVINKQSLGGMTIEYHDNDNRFYAYAEDGRFLFSGEATFAVWECVKLTARVAELEAREQEAGEGWDKWWLAYRGVKLPDQMGSRRDISLDTWESAYLAGRESMQGEVDRLKVDSEHMRRSWAAEIARLRAELLKQLGE